MKNLDTVALINEVAGEEKVTVFAKIGRLTRTRISSIERWLTMFTSAGKRLCNMVSFVWRLTFNEGPALRFGHGFFNVDIGLPAFSDAQFRTGLL